MVSLPKISNSDAWVRDGAWLIRVDEVWMAAQPFDMRMGSEAALARVFSVFGAAHPHQAYVLANRMKALVHYGIGVWLVVRRLNAGKFVWTLKTPKVVRKPFIHEVSTTFPLAVTVHFTSNINAPQQL